MYKDRTGQIMEIKNRTGLKDRTGLIVTRPPKYKKQNVQEMNLPKKKTQQCSGTEKPKQQSSGNAPKNKSGHTSKNAGANTSVRSLRWWWPLWRSWRW